MQEDRDDKFRQIIATALMKASDSELRPVIIEQVKNTLTGYDCQQIIVKAISPVIAEVVKELMDDELFMADLRKSVEAKIKSLKVQIELVDRRY